MRTATRIAFLTAPLLVLPVLAALYTHLNIDSRMFVGRFGCGCDPFFNTNHLSITVCSLLLAGAASCWWLAARGLARTWFWTLAVVFVVLGLEFFGRFMDHNEWL